jgi:2-methylisocitrate lyase-like PEP mutase family enzyme
MEDLRDGGRDLLPIDRFCAKVAAVRAVGEATDIPLVLNARTDVFLGRIGDPATRLERAVERGRAYLEAGADCIFVPGVVDPAVITALVQGVDGPVSVLSIPGSPYLTDLKALGVARISTGSGPYRAALALARRMATEAYGEGSLESMIAAQVSFADVQELFES